MYTKNRLYRYDGAKLARKVRQIRRRRAALEKKDDTVFAVMQQSGWSEEKTRAVMSDLSERYQLKSKDVLLFKVWELSEEEIAQLPSSALIRKLIRKYNTGGWNHTSDKVLFDKTFAKYVKRKNWSNAPDATLESFLETFAETKTIFCKPLSAQMGDGAQRIDLDNPEEVYRKLMKQEPLIVEECIIQHPDMARLNDSCINTIRINTVVTGPDTYDYIGISVRVGNGGIVDNFSANGLAVSVDPETGVLTTDAIDRVGNVYETHPITGTRFKGYQLPCWDQVRQLIDEVVFVLPNLRYVGWDVAITDKNEAVLVEGNNLPGARLLQAPLVRDRKFIAPHMKSFLELEI